MNEKILLVEDNPEYAAALSMRLDSMGYSLICADTMASALSKLVSRKPTLSLIDINLPDGDGFTLAKQMRSNPNSPDIPVIFITASRNRSYRETALQYSPVAYLEKPFDAQQLIEAIEASSWTGVDLVAHRRSRRAH